MGMIQIRNVPDDLHRKLKARAAKAGMSLSDYLLGEIRSFADLPDDREFFEHLKAQAERTLSEEPVDIIRAHRDATDL